MGKGSQLRIQRLQTKLAHDRELLESLEQKQSALYKQLNHTGNAGDRLDLNRQIKALEEEIEDVLARYEATEQQLAELQGGRILSQPSGVDPPVAADRNQRREVPVQAALEKEQAQQRREQLQREQEAERLKQQEEERQRQERERAQRERGDRQQSAEHLDIVPPPNVQTFKFEVVSITSVEKTGILGLGKPRVNLNRLQNSAEYFSEDLGNGVSLEMVSIPGGPFIMGSPEKEAYHRDTEGPQHQVTVPAFFMGKYPVTQVQWQVVADLPTIERDLNPDPARFKGVDRPVERVSWLDAVEFCARLSHKTGRQYRLPREAEWEYACRAGTTTPFHFGETITPDLANYNGIRIYGSGPQGKKRVGATPVGHFKVANAFGLYDMHGNVWEWCADHWHDTYEGTPDDGTIWLSRVSRGGSWINPPWDCRSASRGRYNRDDAFSNIGFRVVCAAPRFS